MPIHLYSFKLRREVSLLSDDEYQPIKEVLAHQIQGIKNYRGLHKISLEEAKRRSCGDVLRYYEELTGVRLLNPDELYAVQLSRYGRPCPNCKKLFRTPKAKLCAECGFELPHGAIAGSAALSDI